MPNTSPLPNRSAIDWAPVRAAVDAFSFPEDAQLIKECIGVAYDQWYDDDCVELRITGVEEMLTAPRMKGYLDIRGVFTGQAAPSRGAETAKKIQALAGKRVICDWKTSWAPLDEKWTHRYFRDWQWRIYSQLEDAEVFWFRGVAVTPFGENPRVKDVIITVTPEVKAQAKQYVSQLFTLRDNLVTLGETPWPKFWPCKNTSFTCPFLRDCLDLTEPPGNVPLDKVMSYSRWREFTQCPELHRRKGLLEDGEPEKVTQFGIAFHAGMAEVYKQLQESQCKTDGK